METVTVTPDPPPGAALLISSQEEANPILAEVQALALVTQTDANRASEHLSGLKKLLKRIDARFEIPLAPARAAVKRLLEMKREATAPVEAAHDELNSRLLLWSAEQRAAAESAARVAAEAARKAEEERVLAEAKAHEAAGEPHLAEMLLDGPMEALVPVVAMPVAAPTFSGLATKTYYSAKVVSLRDLVVAVAAGKAPLEALLPNQTYLNDQARTFKTGFRLPGVELASREGLADKAK